MLTDYIDACAGDYRPYKDGRWCHEDGCIYRRLELLHRATGEPRWLDHLTRLIAPQIQLGPALRGYDRNEYNIDNIQAGRGLLYLHEVTGQARYLEVARLLIDQLETHPRTRSGVCWHKLRYPWQIWLDGLYMAPRSRPATRCAPATTPCWAMRWPRSSPRSTRPLCRRGG